MGRVASAVTPIQMYHVTSLILQVDVLIPIDRSINPMPCCADVVQSLVENLGLGIGLNGLLFFCFFFMFIGSMF